ncbi:Bug family tripartite tricarboxylate transporter substrate binding protein [Paracandidimonas soli]|uniref:Tripartite-type tricarboxylate transporter receptor subunit TctC n=1 Tax=Paracandidimonas soli TaxID=1917182 RepID=A0A4R3V180_9BURK|nr:tripartite tricarboxylate transporter substrate binding protein [Paracandidimonas soli]TCU98495.1 tripartite-type tricarboxylate transporter receptor subunit TctC [Paracandidimonas soli]
MKRILMSTLIILCSAAMTAKAEYPDRIIRLVVPTAPGGGSDTVGRLLAQKLGAALNGNVVVENKPGAGGLIGTQDLLRAPADGYTLLLATSSTHGINPWLYPEAGYDVKKDFTAVSILATTDYGLAVQKSSPYQSLGDLLAAAKKDQVNYGSSGVGNTGHLATELLAKDSGSKFDHVPYRAAMPALNGLLGGEITFIFENTSLFTPYVKDQRLRLLGTTGAERSRITPDVPTIKETVPGYEVIGWFALVARSGAPAPVIERLNQEVVKILQMPDVIERLHSLGYEPAPRSVADSNAFVASQLDTFGAMIKRAGITATKAK